MNYPLQLTFKTIAIAQQISITDAQGNLIYYVKQKAFKLKEAVTVFTDSTQTNSAFTIGADRILDFNARYTFKSVETGANLGGVKRQGVKSLWKTHFDIQDSNENALLTITEENPWIKVADALFSELPIIGMFAGYVFHPVYLVSRPDGTVIMRLKKQPAFFEGKFTLEKAGEPSFSDDKDAETRVLLALIMMILIERSRG
jgi:hypothetical protein